MKRGLSARAGRLVLAVAIFAAAAARADWDLHHVNGRDYVGIENVATFYHLTGDPAPVGNKIRLQGGRHQIIVAVNSREANIDGVNHWMSFPVIAIGGKYYVTRMDLGKTIEPALRPEMLTGLGPVGTVVLDPGHGGHDFGAVGAGDCEKNFALDVARRVRNDLQRRGVKVVMTRNSDTFIPLEQRAAIANAIPNSIFVCIHFNTADSNHVAHGFEIYSVAPRGTPSTSSDALSERDLAVEPGDATDVESFALSCSIYHSMMGHMEMFDRGVKRSRFAVLRLTRVPAVLIEGGFLSNAGDAASVAAKDWRDRYAAAIAEGVMQYKQLAERKTPPRLMAEYGKTVPQSSGEWTPAVVEPSESGVKLRQLP